MTNNTPKTTKTQKRKYAIVGTPIHANKGNVTCQVIGNVCTKDIISKWILDRPFPSIAIDVRSLHEIERAGGEYIEFTCTDNGIIYRSSVSKFWTLGKHINYVGEQVALGLEHFEHLRDPNQSPATDTDAPAYSEATETKPLVYKSHAVTGTHFTQGKQTPKQLRMFGNGGRYG